jgi:hypothetical protein
MGAYTMNYKLNHKFTYKLCGAILAERLFQVYETMCSGFSEACKKNSKAAMHASISERLTVLPHFFGMHHKT